MACRVGITTNPKRRKEEWKRVYPNMKNWKVYSPFASRKEAQMWEDKTKIEYGCVASPGGNEPDDPDAVWRGYYFEYKK